MNFSFNGSVFSALFISFFTTSCYPSLTKKEVIGYSVAAVAGAAALTGAYLLWNGSDDDSLDNVEVVDKNGEKVLQTKAIEKKKFKQVLADALKFMIVPSAVGFGTYWILNKHTLEGKLKNFDDRNEKIKLGLDEKFSDGTSSIVNELGLPEVDLIKFVDSNFGKDTHCPLIEAEKYLKEQKEFLQKQINFVYQEQPASRAFDQKNIKELSDKISFALDVIQKQVGYQEQLKRYDSLERDRFQREELSTQRKYDFAKILLIIAGTSIVAGKIVAPFVE